MLWAGPKWEAWVGVILGVWVESLQVEWEESCLTWVWERPEEGVRWEMRGAPERGCRVRLKGRHVVECERRQVVQEVRVVLPGCVVGQEGSVRLEVRN